MHFFSGRLQMRLLKPAQAVTRKLSSAQLCQSQLPVFSKLSYRFANVITPDMHVEVEDAEQQKRSQSGGCQRVERLVDDQEPEEKYSRWLWLSCF